MLTQNTMLLSCVHHFKSLWEKYAVKRTLLFIPQFVDLLAVCICWV